MNYEIAHHSQKSTKTYAIPNNLHEIVKSSLPRDLDVTNLVKTEATAKILNDEMNDFNFYNIPFHERIDPEKMMKTGYADFKSVHKLQAFNEKRGITTTGKFFQKRTFTEFEKRIRKELKTNTNKLLLREIYENFDKCKTESFPTLETPSPTIHLTTFQNEDLDKKVVQELEAWERLRTAPLKIEKESKEQGGKNMKEQVSKKEGLKWGMSVNMRESQKVPKNMKESQKVPNMRESQRAAPVNMRESQKNMKESQINMGESQALMNKSITKKGLSRKQESLPILIKSDSVLGEDSAAKEKLLKFARNEQFKDETLGKTLINYLKGYDSPEVIQNRLKQKKHSLRSQDKTEEKLGLSIAELNKQIKLMFLTKIEGPLIERARSHQQMTTNVLVKILKKIKDSEAFLNSRSLTMITIRTENGSILEKLKSIKDIIISLREKIQKNKRGKSVASVNNDSGELKDSLSNRSSSIGKKATRKMNREDSNLLPTEKKIVLNFMEKALDEQQKEEEINQLNENKINFEKKLKFNNEILTNMEAENQMERKNLKEAEKIRRSFLFELLLEGKDCRNNGLAWIILELWKLGESIYFQNLPKFLDQKAKEFLLTKAKKEQEIMEVATVFQTFLENVQGVFRREQPNGDEVIEQESRRMIETKVEAEQNLRESLFNKSYYQEPSIIDRTCADSLIRDSKGLNDIFQSRKSTNDQVYEEARKKLRLEVSPKKKSLDEKKESKLQIMPSSQMNDYSIIYIENDKKINEYKTKEHFFKESESLERKIREKQQQVLKLEKAEIVRIIKEFDYQEYGFKYSTDCECVLSALIGARKAYIELIRYGMLKKNN